MYLGKAIRSINPNARFMLEGEDLNNIQWIEDTAPISVADIEAKIQELKAEDEANEQAKEDLKASAKAKLVAGTPLTEEEANTIVL